MKIAINCRSFLKKQYTGIGRYAFHLVQSLSEIDSNNDYYLYVKKGIFNFRRKIPQFKAENYKVKMDRFNSGLDKTLGDVDIYHSPSPDYLDMTLASKTIVTVHDLIYKTFPQGHTQDTIKTTDRHINEIVEKADKIICCSQSTINDLKEYFPVKKERVSLVYQGVDKNNFHPIPKHQEALAKDIIRKRGVEGPFILFVGTIEPRKNLENLVRALAILKEKNQFEGKLVVIGMKGWLTDGISIMIDGLGLKADVIFLGYLPSEELRYFYNQAEVFVFPSFYEGFGFPLVEAMSCGAVVITSNSSSCPEIAGGAAILVDPHYPEDIAEEIRKIINDPQRKEALKEKALRRSEDFSFLKTAKETLKVYEEVYKQ